MSPSPSSSKLNKSIVEPISLYHAYHRSAEIGRSRRLASRDYSELFTVSVPDISRSDNESLARSSRDIMAGMQTLANQLPGRSESFIKQMLRLAFEFSGEPQTEGVIEDIYQEAIIEPSASSYEHRE